MLRGFTLEIFGGCARLTRCLSDAGFEALAIDGPRNRHRPVGPTVTFDLTKEQGVAWLWKLLKHPRVCFVLLAPPCGTSSRARDIPISEQDRADNCPGIKPLRGPGREVWGLDSLEGTDLLKVRAANQLYSIAAEVAE